MVRELFEGASARVLIVSAYVGEAAVRALLEVSDHIGERALFARWDVDDLALGASDWRVWDVAREHNVRFFACPRLHAKLYIADNRALVGSANATAPGLGMRNPSNLELLVEEDANHPRIAALVRYIEKTSAPAAPLGSDMATASSANGEREDDGMSTFPVWLPASEPREFLDVMRGKKPHNDLTSQDCKDAALANARPMSRHAIRLALRDMTAFRIVRMAFEERLSPMRLSELRTLLDDSLEGRFAHVDDASLSRLAAWLGAFGENTHAIPVLDSGELVLEPGPVLTSDDELLG